MNQENKTVTIDARYDFTAQEMSALGVKASQTHKQRERAEEEFKSVKADWKAKLERIELERDDFLRKLGDGFEMRPTQAVVSFNDPRPGRKTFRFQSITLPSSALGGLAGGCVMEGAIIREEAMDATDYQRDLPLEESVYVEPGAVHNIIHTRENWSGVDPEHFPETGDGSKEIAEARDKFADDAAEILGCSPSEFQRSEMAAILKTASEPIGTSFADKLTQALQGATVTPVVIDFPANYGGDKYRAIWRKAAKKQGWPEAAIDLIDGIAQDTQLASELGKKGCAQRVLDVIGSHSISNAAHSITRSDDQPDAEKLAGTFGVTEEEA